MTARSPRQEASLLARVVDRLRQVSPVTWLVLAMGVYFAVSFSLSWLRALELQTTTWDQGLYQQALWSTAQGRTFYETADVETGGYHSLLQVHTVFVFYALVPLYAAFPSEATLFVVQSAVVALAAVPLFLLTRDLTRSGWLGLVSGLIYLAWTPTLAANLYDFHPEAFLPIELFSVVLFWQRERFLAGFLVVLVACATLELAPIMLFFVGIFFLLPSRSGLVRWWSARRAGAPSQTFRSSVGPWLRLPRVRASIALLIVSLGAYAFLVYLQSDALISLLGVTTLSEAPTGYVLGVTANSLGLALSNLSVGFFQKLGYWFLLVALLGFIPLFAPRALVLSAPWFAFTMLSSNLNYVELGFQYGFIAASTLLVAFAYGLPRVVALWHERVRTDVVPSSAPRDTTAEARRRIAPSARWMVAGLAFLVAVNVALSPVNPLLQNHGLGSAYRLSYGGATGNGNVEEVVGLIPAGATVVASDNLFPLVSNDVNAYSFFWTQNNFLALPFTPSDPPGFVLLAQNRTAAVPGWLASELYDPSVYAVRAVDWNSAAGAIVLYEVGYGGAPTLLGPAPSSTVSRSGASIANALAGYTLSDPGSNTPLIAANAPGTSGLFFDGPWVDLPEGIYHVALNLTASGLEGFPSPTPAEAVLTLNVSAFGQSSLLNRTLNYSALAGSGWASTSFEVSLEGPTLEFAVGGTALAPNVQVFLAGLTITPG